jgi:hypothetical protein
VIGIELIGMDASALERVASGVGFCSTVDTRG